MKKQWIYSLLLVLTAFLWGTTFVAQSEAMNYVKPFTYNAFRMMVGAIVLLPLMVVRARKETKKIINPKGLLVSGIVCGLALFGGSSFQQIGMQYTSAGKAGFITALYIVLVPVIGIFLKKKTSWSIWISVALGVIGFYFLCMKGFEAISLGDGVILLCAVVFSIHILVVDHFSLLVDPVQLSSLQFLVTSVVSFVVMFILEKPEWAQIWAARYTILYAGVLSCGVAYTLQIVAQREVKPVIATLIMSLESVFSVLAGMVVLGERLSHREWIGCILVFIAVILAQIPLTGRRERTNEQKEAVRG